MIKSFFRGDYKKIKVQFRRKGDTEPVDMFDNIPQFRISKHHYTESQGLGWARHITNTLYDGEEFTLQIDSHHRFVQVAHSFS